MLNKIVLILLLLEPLLRQIKVARVALKCRSLNPSLAGTTSPTERAKRIESEALVLILLLLEPLLRPMIQKK